MMNKRVRQYLICLVAIVVAILYILTLLSSTSTRLSGLYLVRLHNNVTHDEVRVGLVGLCFKSQVENLTCSSTFTQNLTDTMAKAPADLKPLITLANGFFSSSTGAGGVPTVVFAPLLIGGIFFLVAVAALLTHEAVKGDANGYTGSLSGDYMDKRDVHKVRSWQVVGIMTTYSVAAAVGGATATTLACRALQFTGTVLPGAVLSAAQKSNRATVQTQGGTAVQVMVWLVVGLTLVWHLLMTLVWKKM